MTDQIRTGKCRICYQDFPVVGAMRHKCDDCRCAGRKNRPNGISYRNPYRQNRDFSFAFEGQAYQNAISPDVAIPCGPVRISYQFPGKR